MPVVKYTYTISSDFGGDINNLNMSQLHKAIADDAGITPVFDGISMEGDNVDIIFTTALSGAEQTTLNGLISGHTPVVKPTYSRKHDIIPKKSFTKNTTYDRIVIFEYPGSAYGSAIINIICISHMDSNCTSYDIKILDKTNNLVIAENNFTNTTEAKNILTPVNNIPTDESIIEIYVRKVGGVKEDKIYVQSLLLSS